MDGTEIAAAILLVMRFVIAGVFIRAGTAKLFGLAEFRLAVKNYEIVPAALTAFTAASVVAVECTAGLLLLLGILQVVVAAVLAVLLLCFSAAIATNLIRGRVFDCGCDGGSAAPRTISWSHVSANVVLAAMAAAISIAPPGGLDLLYGPRGLFSISIPAGSCTPIVLAAVLAYVTVRMSATALAAYKLTRAAQG
jgi:uncharacterized membrane protein YphA (DoxX/SURF4 family)